MGTATQGNDDVTGRAVAVLRALSALVLTTALVVGVPLLLILIVGNPLPSSVPSVDEIRILLTQNGDGFANFLVAAIAVLLWLVWAQLVAALIVEIIATVRQTETRKIAALPGLQSLAARLIAAMTLATTLAVGPLLAPAAGALSLGEFESAGPATTLIVEAEHTSPISPSLASAPELSQDGRTKVLVCEQTELWDLADAAYGDGVSWKLIAAANVGTVDATGAVITGDTELIPPGTEIVVPHLGGTKLNAGFATNSAIHVVEAGDSMWSVAEARLAEDLDRAPLVGEVGDYWRDVVDANANVASGDVDLIYPGEELLLPDSGVDASVGHESASLIDGEPDAVVVDVALDRFADGTDRTPTSVSEVDASTDQVDQVVEVSVVDAPALVDAEDPSLDAPAIDSLADPNPGDASEPGSDASIDLRSIGVVAMGSAVLAAGVVGALRRRRDLQRRLRPANAMAPAVLPQVAAIEAEMVHASHEFAEGFHGDGWRLLPLDGVDALRSHGPVELHASETGRLHAIAIIDDGVNGAESRRVEMTPGMGRSEIEAVLESSSTGLHLESDSSEVHPTDMSQDLTPAAPTALIVGTDTTTGDAVFVDLESSDILGLTGSELAIERFARSAVLDLATSDRAHDLCVVAVGCGDRLNGLERVSVADTYSEAVALAVRSGHASPDATTPVVVVSTRCTTAEPDAVTALTQLGACIVAQHPGATAEIVLDQGTATVLPSGTQVELAALDDQHFSAVTELVEGTAVDAVELVDGHPGRVEARDSDEVIDVTSGPSQEIEPGPIDVKVLGPVEIAGADSFSSLKAVDVVSYLAFHRHGADADQIKAWVWPAFEPPSDKAFANVLSRARTGLGTNDDGEPLLSRAQADKTYRLSDAVTTDFDRFRGFVAKADQAADRVEMLGMLQRAVELIRGVPFSGGGATGFVWADNHVRAQVEFTIDETVHRCADLALELDELAIARWAALKGLELVPGCEQCFRRRFLVAGAGNDLSELRRAMADLERSAAAELGEPEAVDMISGELIALYHELDRAMVVGTS